MYKRDCCISPPTHKVRKSRFGSIWLLTTFLFIASTHAQEVDPWHPDVKAMDRLVETYRQQYRVPGLAVVVTNGNEVVYIRGLGHDSIGHPISTTTRFPIASLSKSFTALAVMQLSEQGKFKLDEPIHQHLPEFEIADPRGNQITIRQLLSHTSGMSDRTFPEKSIPLPDSLTDAVARLRLVKLVSAPGTKRHYHNPNYWVAARLVEVSSGLPFETYLRERIFSPLEMHHTFAVDSLSMDSGIANGHIRFFGYPISRPEPSWFLGGAAGVITTAEDMGRWLTFQNTQVAPRGDRLISAAGFDELHQGLGWSVDVREGQRNLTHNGILFTFTARQYLLPNEADRLGVAVMANTGIGLAPNDSDAIAHALVEIVQRQSLSWSGPSGILVGAGVGLLSLLIVLLGLFAWRRAENWASVRRGRAGWRTIVTQIPGLVPWVLLVFYPRWIKSLSGGRDLNWIQSLYVSSPLFALVATWALVITAVIAARVVALWRRVPETIE